MVYKASKGMNQYPISSRRSVARHESKPSPHLHDPQAICSRESAWRRKSTRVFLLFFRWLRELVEGVLKLIVVGVESEFVLWITGAVGVLVRVLANVFAPVFVFVLIVRILFPDLLVWYPVCNRRMVTFVLARGAARTSMRERNWSKSTRHCAGKNLRNTTAIISPARRAYPARSRTCLEKMSSSSTRK
ncbi:hypothetical protein B0H11DRAFT_162208 [Mycena galericulata]|nr:hypothetical protein B0H11DRAFT_162208 [Mycena galericulata]